MAKSLTEAARAVLMKEETALAATLKPGSKSVDPSQTLGSATKLADPVIQPNGADGSNLGAAAAAGIKTDTSVNTVTFAASGSDIVSFNAAWVGLNEQWETCRALAIVDSAGQGRWVIMMARSV